MVQTVPFSYLREGDRFIVESDLNYTGGVVILVKTGDNTYKLESNDNKGLIFPHVNVIKIRG